MGESSQPLPSIKSPSEVVFEDAEIEAVYSQYRSTLNSLWNEICSHAGGPGEEYLPRKIDRFIAQVRACKSGLPRDLALNKYVEVETRLGALERQAEQFRASAR